MTPKVKIWIEDPTGCWFVPEPVIGLLAAFEAAGDDAMAYSPDDIERILAGLSKLTELRERLAKDDADEFDAGILRRAASILRDRFGVLVCGDLIEALGKAALTVEDGQ